MTITPEGGRVLGCLVEKQLTTPQQYPLTGNALALACSQATNRHPVVAMDEDDVMSALDALKAERVVRFVRTLVADGVAHPLAPPDMVATAASGMAVRFAPLIAARPADRDQIMDHLMCLYLQTLGIDSQPRMGRTEEPS